MNRALLAPFCGAGVYRLIGSAIETNLIRHDLSTAPDDPHIIYWCCGMRDTGPIASDLLQHCTFAGVRGPMTRDRLGLPETTPIGDPGLFLPLLHKPDIDAAPGVGKTVCMPHFSQRGEHALARATGADMILSPAVRSEDELLALIDAIASADFVLTGSLHGAIVACAYGRPFAFWDSGFIDIPFKWADFAASIGVEAAFATTIDEGRACYQAMKSRMGLPLLSPILGACPFAVRPSLVAAALAHDTRDLDIGSGDARAQAMQQCAERMWFDRGENIAAVQAREAQRIEAGSRRDRVARRTARGAAAQELRNARSNAARLLDALDKREKILTAEVGPGQPILEFGADKTGAIFLEEGWTPPNEIAPWTLPPKSTMRFPLGVGWEEARAITFEGYLFAPLVEPARGRRRICVWAGLTMVWNDIIINNSESHSCMARFSFLLSDQARRSDLVITLALDEVGSARSLGVGDDDRPIGFAPLRLILDYG